MMKRKSIYTICAAAALACSGMTATAQALQSGYFMEGYTFRHLMNPAYAAERNYVSIPALGNVNVGTQGTVGLSKFLFPYQGDQLTTFMNSSVSSAEFLGGLKDNNRINANVNLTLLSGGFKAWGGYNTVDLSVRSQSSISLPYELFEFMKLGMQGTSTSYDMSDLGVSSRNFVQLAFGHSRDLTGKLRVGAKVKILMGLARVDMKMTDMHVELNQDKWMVSANGEMNMALKGLEMPTKEEAGRVIDNPSQKDLIDWDSMDNDGVGLTGFGLAVDLGATYKLMDNLTLSASILDLGFLSWSNNVKGVTKNQPWVFEGFKELAVSPELGDDDPNSLKGQAEALGKDLEDYASFHRESTGSGSSGLGATLNVGVEYALPMYDRLRFGLLSTTRLQGIYSWTEGRLSANVTPVDWVDAGVNVAMSSFGASFGWIVNFHPKGFNFFVGMDQLMGKVNPQFIPVDNMNMNLSFGMNVTF